MMRLARLVPFASLASLAAAPLAAQAPGITALPDSVVQRIDLAVAVAGGPTAPGCAIGVSRDSKVLLTRGWGLANLEYDVPNSAETVFESGSVAKQFTAAALVLLAQDGKLSLDDDIRSYIPELHDFGKTITIRHLLTHTSGLRDWYTLAALRGHPAGTHVHSRATVLDMARHQRTLNFDPGAEYLYSNTGYILASLVVDRVAGMPFAAFTDERIFRPLGMSQTHWRDDFRKTVKARAAAYNGSASRGYTLDMPFTNVIGSGGLLTTVGDWLRWTAFLDDPTTLPGGASLVQTMTVPMRLNNGKAITYALGLVVTTRDAKREISHSGATGGYRTWLGRYPDDRLTVAVLCNAGGGVNPTIVAHTAADAVLGIPARRAQVVQAGGVPASELDRYVGTYAGRDPETSLIVVKRDSTLVVRAGAAQRPLMATGPSRFRLGAADVDFLVANGKVTRVVQVQGGDSAVFTPVPGFMPSAAERKAFVGSYYSNELDARFTVVATDTGLVMRLAPAPEIALAPVLRDTFRSDAGTFAFMRDGSGGITGVAIWDGRARNIRFSRER